MSRTLYQQNVPRALGASSFVISIGEPIAVAETKYCFDSDYFINHLYGLNHLGDLTVTSLISPATIVVSLGLLGESIYPPFLCKKSLRTKNLQAYEREH